MVMKLVTVVLTVMSVLTVSCRSEEEENASETKFTALAQTDGWRSKIRDYLIKKVRNDKITIVYGFSDNKYCNKQFSDRDEQLKESISKVLRVWLAPLANRDKIVNEFEYDYRETHKDGDRRKFNYPLFGIGNHPDLSIIFYCEEGRSFARIRSHAMIHMYQGKYVHYGVSDLKKYRLTTLLHELGHAFGLGDTYVDSTEESSWGRRYNVSDGGNAKTVGRQPISVMNLYYLVALNSAGDLQLGDDDIAGMNWLYDYHVAKTINSLKDCPADYRYEDSTKGCAPHYPLIFAVKQNDFQVVHQMLNDDPNINLNQQDELGNTALHYAANAKKLHDSYLYDYLIDEGANTQLKNNKGETPQDLVGEKKNRENMEDSLLSLLIWQVSSPAVLRQIKYILQQVDGAKIVKATFGLPFVNINARAGERATLFFGKPPEDAVGYTLLHRAVIENELEIVKILLDSPKIDVNIQSKLSEETALHYAARYGHLEIAQLLLKHAEIDTALKDTWGKSPLARAMSEGQIEVWQAIKDSLND